jgi:alpha-tubulin suppressor-like RCC1 family protein
VHRVSVAHRANHGRTHRAQSDTLTAAATQKQRCIRMQRKVIEPGRLGAALTLLGVLRALLTRMNDLRTPGARRLPRLLAITGLMLVGCGDAPTPDTSALASAGAGAALAVGQLTGLADLASLPSLHRPHLASIVGGNTAACALDFSGHVLCWGEGPVAYGASAGALIPTRVEELGRFTTLALGREHACGIVAGGGSVRCWGNNDALQLGGETTEPYLDVHAAGGVKTVSTGDDYTCMVAGNGQAYCWGSVCSGHLGDGLDCNVDEPAGRPYDMARPVLLPAGMTVATVRSSFNMSCALTDFASVFCWGSDGTRAYPPQLVTSQVAESAALVDATSLCVGARHACAHRTDRSVACWGENNLGQLGDGTTGSTARKYVQVSGLSDVSSIACGGQHTCALLPSGELSCWGDNALGELGSGDATLQLSATPIAPIASGDVVAVFAGGYSLSTFVVHRRGEIEGWGQNSQGQLGIGTRGTIEQAPQALFDN